MSLSRYSATMIDTTGSRAITAGLAGSAAGRAGLRRWPRVFSADGRGQRAARTRSAAPTATATVMHRAATASRPPCRPRQPGAAGESRGSFRVGGSRVSAARASCGAALTHQRQPRSVGGGKDLSNRAEGRDQIGRSGVATSRDGAWRSRRPAAVRQGTDLMGQAELRAQPVDQARVGAGFDADRPARSPGQLGKRRIKPLWPDQPRATAGYRPAAPPALMSLSGLHHHDAGPATPSRSSAMARA